MLFALLWMLGSEQNVDGPNLVPGMIRNYGLYQKNVSVMQKMGGPLPNLASWEFAKSSPFASTSVSLSTAMTALLGGTSTFLGGAGILWLLTRGATLLAWKPPTEYVWGNANPRYLGLSCGHHPYEPTLAYIRHLVVGSYHHALALSRLLLRDRLRLS